MFFMYDLQRILVECIRGLWALGKWCCAFRSLLVLLRHTRGKHSGKPQSLYAFYLWNLKLHSKVQNLPKPDDKRFPMEDSYVHDHLACLLKINDFNDKLALIWNTMDCYSDDLTMLLVVKFTIVKSETGKLFEACILSKVHCTLCC